VKPSDDSEEVFLAIYEKRSLLDDLHDTRNAGNVTSKYDGKSSVYDFDVGYNEQCESLGTGASISAFTTSNFSQSKEHFQENKNQNDSCFEYPWDQKLRFHEKNENDSCFEYPWDQKIGQENIEFESILRAEIEQKLRAEILGGNGTSGNSTYTVWGDNLIIKRTITSHLIDNDNSDCFNYSCFNERAKIQTFSKKSSYSIPMRVAHLKETIISLKRSMIQSNVHCYVPLAYLISKECDQHRKDYTSNDADFLVDYMLE